MILNGTVLPSACEMVNTSASSFYVIFFLMTQIYRISGIQKINDPPFSYELIVKYSVQLYYAVLYTVVTLLKRRSNDIYCTAVQ